MVKKSKIAIMHIINAYALGGAEKLVFDIASRMDKTKFDVFVCSIGAQGNDLEETLRRYLQSQGIQTLSLAKTPRKQRMRAVLKLTKFLRTNKIDIIHTHCPSPDFYGKLAAFLVRTPLVFSTVHTVQGYSPFNERILQRVTAKYVAISKTVKEYTARELKIPLAKIKIIYNAVDIQRFAMATVDRESKLRELGITNNSKIVATIGSITKPKGHIYLIEAAEEVIEEFPDVYFLIVGDDKADPETINQLKEAIKAKRIQNRITFTGVRADIPEILSITDVFVLPSLWEGFGLVLIEAMAAGIPVVTTSTGIAPEAVRDGVNGLVVLPKDSQALAQKIRELLSDPEKARKLGTEGQRAVEEKFDIENTVQGYEELYLRKS